MIGHPAATPATNLRLQQVLENLIYLSRISLTLGFLHHLADEKANQLVFAGPVLSHLRRILVDDLLHNGLDRRVVCNLLETLRFDDFVGTTLAVPHCFEDLLRDFAGNRVVVNPVDQASKISG